MRAHWPKTVHVMPSLGAEYDYADQPSEPALAGP